MQRIGIVAVFGALPWATGAALVEDAKRCTLAADRSTDTDPLPEAIEVAPETLAIAAVAVPELSGGEVDGVTNPVEP
jgi:hypothetical protein